MHPDPNIAQEQRNANKQQPQGRVTGGGLDASLTELAVAGLDAEAILVDLQGKSVLPLVCPVIPTEAGIHMSQGLNSLSIALHGDWIPVSQPE
jgi:hypothetical protein